MISQIYTNETDFAQALDALGGRLGCWVGDCLITKQTKAFIMVHYLHKQNIIILFRTQARGYWVCTQPTGLVHDLVDVFKPFEDITHISMICYGVGLSAVKNTMSKWSPLWQEFPTGIVLVD